MQATTTTATTEAKLQDETDAFFACLNNPDAELADVVGPKPAGPLLSCPDCGTDTILKYDDDTDANTEYGHCVDCAHAWGCGDTRRMEVHA